MHIGWERSWGEVEVMNHETQRSPAGAERGGGLAAASRRIAQP
jgi:hypothetical protein